MNTNKEISRLTVDIPKSVHTKLKTIAAMRGKTIRDIFLEAMPYIEESNICALSSHIPNEDTLESIRNIEEGKNLTEYENVDELFKKLGLLKE